MPRRRRPQPGSCDHCELLSSKPPKAKQVHLIFDENLDRLKRIWNLRAVEPEHPPKHPRSGKLNDLKFLGMVPRDNDGHPTRALNSFQ